MTLPDFFQSLVTADQLGPAPSRAPQASVVATARTVNAIAQSTMRGVERRSYYVATKQLKRLELDISDSVRSHWPRERLGTRPNPSMNHCNVVDDEHT